MALTPDQWRAVLSPGAIACIAGAGSGKTSVMAERYLRMVREGVSPHRILAVTFTTDAAFELKKRILSLGVELPAPTLQLIRITPFIGTIHSLCYRILNTDASRIGLPGVQEILTDARWYSILTEEESRWRGLLAHKDLEHLDRAFGIASLATLSAELYARNVTSLPDNTPLESTERDELLFLLGTTRPLIEALTTRLQKNGIYSFNDLERLTLEILKAPEAQRFYQSQFQAILIDECQDISPRQFKILNSLTSNPAQLFIVGDPRQSIYRFRQADVALFNAMVEGIEHQKGTRVTLTANFRSQRTLLEGINRITRTIFEDPSTELSAGRQPSVPVPVRILRYSLQETSESTIKEEHTLIVQAIENLLAHKESSIAILFRQGDRMSLLQDRLAKAYIGSNCKKANRLFDSYTALDISAFLHALLNPLDDYWLSAFLRSQFIGFSMADLVQLNFSPGKTLFERLLNRGEPRWFLQLVESRVWCVEKVLQALFFHCQAPGNWTAASFLMENLLNLSNHLPEAVELLDCWQRINLLYTAETNDTNPVVLATVHSAKGLEFNHVFIADCCRKPTQRQPILLWDPYEVPALRFRSGDEWVESNRYQELREAERAADEAESRRILYVALTRARETLTLLLPKEKAPKGSWAELLAQVAMADDPA